MAAGKFPHLRFGGHERVWGMAHAALAADLRSRDTLIWAQIDFRQKTDSETTVKKPHDYIRDCVEAIGPVRRRGSAQAALTMAAASQNNAGPF